ncbi:Aminodeoxychorismate synthase component 1 [bacterium HR30]|nr:Aminodeoxychorismate synthase component 1 [bacterium HR30]
MPTQAAWSRVIAAAGDLVHRSSAAPALTVRLQGSGRHSWGCGLALRARGPVALLRVEDYDRGRVETADAVELWHGEPFVLFERFCRKVFASPFERTRHVVVAIQYDAALPSFGLAKRRTGSQPLLIALAYEDPCVERPADVVPSPIPPGAPAACRAKVSAGWSRDQYEAAFHRVLDYIAAGDVYQVNLAYPLRCEQRVAGLPLFEALQRRNPVAFGAYLHAGDFELVSNSPELFLSRRGSWLTTRPIKGTRPRGCAPDEDRARMEELRRDAKERAELTMIVDLERNDLGRICEIGSVEVVAHERVETYATLHHMYSEVRGRLRSGVGWDEILGATFPGGSVTGAPKRRAMQIIDELEVGSRGFYTGALGWLRAIDEADFALLIRTAVVDAAGVEYWTGGGLVADSVAEREYEETRLKARAFEVALEEVG